MLKIVLAFGLAVLGTNAQADDRMLAISEYRSAFLPIEQCFEADSSGWETCAMAAVQECVAGLEIDLANKGIDIPDGAAVSPVEYCSYLGLERADAHLNSVYQRILEQGPLRPSDKDNGIENLRSTQRLWLQFKNEFCSENNIVGWHAGGSGWGAITAECTMRLSIQQAEHLERYFGFEN